MGRFKLWAIGVLVALLMSGCVHVAAMVYTYADVFAPSGATCQAVNPTAHERCTCAIARGFRCTPER